MNKIFPLLLGVLALTAGCTQYDNAPLYYDQAPPRHESEGRVRGDQRREGPPPDVRSNRSNERDLVRQCIRDNKREGQSRRTVEAYCECMGDKMPDHERRPISAWEDAHPRIMKACERRAGWR
ncbi:MAG: hypothetical protein HQL99_12405 [Magnetococcales bacterium]|nr:hypothetical protein [Magnetococcales bacterium]